MLRIVSSIAAQSARLAQEVRNTLIERVPAVQSFDEAGWLLWALAQLNGLEPAEINRLLVAGAKNNQVCQSGSAWGFFDQLIESHRKGINRRVLKKFHEARG